jgi:Icc-related predicted phosphoesterase
MIIDCISDLHGFEPDLTHGDLLIIAGDLTKRDTRNQYLHFCNWIMDEMDQKYSKIIFIAGNHDNILQNDPEFIKDYIKTKREDCVYLCDSGTEFTKDYHTVKLWGTPWTPLFDRVNPKCKAFMGDEELLDSKFSLIPDDIDILITHGPMQHILDTNTDGYACDSSSLRKHINRVQPLFHIFGHIHEQGGNQLMYKHEGQNTWCMNVSHVNEYYEPVNSHIRLVI